MQAATPPDNHAALMALIKARFAELSPQFQAGARYLTDHPDEVAVSSMRSIATRARVQSAALVRLAQQLGFAGWPELKAIFVERLRAGPRGYAAKAGALAGKEGKERDLIADVFTVQQRNLAATESANHSALDAAASLLQAAPRVHVAGFRAAWADLRDTHEFFTLLKKYSVSRLQGLRLAESRFVQPLDKSCVLDLLNGAALEKVAIMAFVGNAGMIQIHSGPVHKIAVMGPWINILDARFNLHLREDHIASAWVVKNPPSTAW